MPRMPAAAGVFHIPADSGCYAEMARMNARLKQQAEKRFALEVEVPVLPGGMGKRLDAMLA